ncbi:MAG: hypothetical protein ACSHX9_01575 [Luteolibacter sp.]
MNSRTIKFANPNDLIAATDSPWACPPKSSFADMILKPSYRELEYRFPVGQTTLRVLPALAGSTKSFMLGAHVIKYPGGRHLHPRSLTGGQPSVFDYAYRWCIKHRPEVIYSKHNFGGYKLLADPMSVFWIVVNLPDESTREPVSVARLVVASGYDGSRGGVAGLGHLVWREFQQKDEAGKLIADPEDPEGCPHLVVDRIQPKGTRYPSYTLRMGRSPSPIQDWLGRMNDDELDFLQPLEQLIHIPDPEEEWKLLAKIMPIELVEEIQSST